MTFKKNLMAMVSAGVLATGLAVAQTPTTPAPGAPAEGVHHHRNHQFMATALGLTDAQKANAKAIFQDARTQSQPIREQLKANRENMQALVKSGAPDDQINQLAATQGNLMGQLSAIRAKAFGKFYAQLTPDQKAKADQMQQNRRERMHSRMQRWHQRQAQQG